MSGHHHWVQMRSDLDDPELRRQGGFERQVRARILGSLITIVLAAVLSAGA